MRTEKGTMDRTCPVCGKRISFLYESPYKAHIKKSIKSCCSWKCAREAERIYYDSMRKKILRDDANTDAIAVIIRDRVKVEAGEKHSLEEWAELYGIDYYTLAEKFVTSTLCITECIETLLTDK